MPRRYFSRPFFKFLGCLLLALLLHFTIDLPDHMRMVLVLGTLMVALWITETLPLAVTALLPLLLFPLFGVGDIGVTASAYGDPIIFLFLGGFILAAALEKQQLHLLFSEKLMQYFGRSAKGIVLSTMLTTAMISMWISNTATAVMMLPIGIGLQQSWLDQHPDATARSRKNFTLSLLLGIAHAANIGGATTLIGTPPNVVMAAQLKSLAGIDLSFSSWLVFAWPLGMAVLFLSWWMMTSWLFPFNFSNGKVSAPRATEPLVLNQAQVRTLWIFGLTALAWIFKLQLTRFFGISLHDMQIGIAGAILLFLIQDGKNRPLLCWKDTRELPWGILLLFGGGIALAGAMESSGIIESIGKWVKALNQLPIWALILLIATVTIFLSEVMSNVALATVLIPVILGVAQALELEVMLLVAPVAFGATLAFMLPMGTPPNGIVYGSGLISQKAMLLAGWWLNWASVLLITLVVLLWFN
mgnify:CR=1 FL=1